MADQPAAHGTARALAGNSTANGGEFLLLPLATGLRVDPAAI